MALEYGFKDDAPCAFGDELQYLSYLHGMRE